MEVRRGFVLVDALALIRFAQEDLHNPLRISFTEEEGVDLGGLRREFWTIMMHQIVKGYSIIYLHGSCMQHCKKSFTDQFCGSLINSVGVMVLELKKFFS